MSDWDAKKFEEVVGRPAEGDDLERVNCKRAGEPNHLFCGLCEIHDKPKFICGHKNNYGPDPDIHDNT